MDPLVRPTIGERPCGCPFLHRDRLRRASRSVQVLLAAGSGPAVASARPLGFTRRTARETGTAPAATGHPLPGLRGFAVLRHPIPAGGRRLGPRRTSGRGVIERCPVSAGATQVLRVLTPSRKFRACPGEASTFTGPGSKLGFTHAEFEASKPLRLMKIQPSSPDPLRAERIAA